MIPLLLVGLVAYTLIAERFLALYGPRAIEEARREGARGRGLIIMRALVAAAPLLGLLGTVMGMISSFEGLLEGGHVAEVSVGIGQALLSTQYGLALAAPGLLAERMLSRRSFQLEQRGGSS
ncbi:MAG: MotA/TolQ/ExbB proton channel family protein [Myxococcota bacterium]